MFSLLFILSTLLLSAQPSPAMSAPRESTTTSLHQAPLPAPYSWNTPGTSPSESMPCGGGDIGMNVWMEKGDIVFYLCRSGAFDENNTLLKAGRVRIRLFPQIDTASPSFRQTLHLAEGYLSITDGQTTVMLWADVHRPVAHVEIHARQRVKATATYESWRNQDRLLDKREAQQTSYKWIIPQGQATTRDHIERKHNTVTFYHQNPGHTVFDFTVRAEGLDSIASQLYNPLANLITGGIMRGMTGTARRYHHLQIALVNHQGTPDSWKAEAERTLHAVHTDADRRRSRQWWRHFWQRSYIMAGTSHGDDSRPWATATRNYTLFRYMLGCNAYGEWPTKFNGGLFTFDPAYVDTAWAFTPDFRKWGGGTHTAQNQRLVYWPLLATGDTDLMKPQFEFYRRILPTAEARSRAYWQHEGACFSEQIENFGLPNPAEYGISRRPTGFDPGVEYNAWLEYEWDTALEFCQMILQAHTYAGIDITPYRPLVESTLRFFDLHYQYLARRRGNKTLDGEGRLVIYPGSACETYKMAYNPSSTIAALQTVLRTYIDLYPHAEEWQAMLRRIPPIPLRTIDGHPAIAPAIAWERVNNQETPQLYPVFPWRIYGVGRPGLDTARHTYLHDPDALRFRSSKGWKQDNIWAACLGLTAEAERLTLEKLADGPHRFPSFWGPGFDWTPDHNQGGAAMIGLHNMLQQEAGGKILLFPAWNEQHDIRFKLHANHQTTVEAELRQGRLVALRVTPESRTRDIRIVNPKITYHP